MDPALKLPTMRQSALTNKNSYDAARPGDAVHAVIRTRDSLVCVLRQPDQFRLEIVFDPAGYLKIFEYDRGVRELVLTTPGSCKINVVKEP